MIRLLIYAALLTFFADMLRKAWMVRADSLVLPIAAAVIVFLVLTVRRCRFLYRRLRRNRIAFIRPRGGFPPQRKHDVR